MQSGKVSIAVQLWHLQLHKFNKKKVKEEDLTKLLYEDDEEFVVKSSELVLTEDPGGREQSDLEGEIPSTMEDREHNDDNQL